MGDIKKMFLQVKVIEEDVDALRFVSRDSDQAEISDYVFVFAFVFKIYLPSVTIYKGSSFQRKLI